MRIFINPGHGLKNNGVYDPGAVGQTGIKEADVVLDIGKCLKEKLQAAGCTTLLVQDGDLSDVVSKSNSWSASYFVSIHCNSVADPTAKGIETYCYKFGGAGEQLARAVQKELIAATGLTDRGVKEGNLHVIRETKCPAILVEVGFISNPKEEGLLKNESFKEKVAQAIFVGLSKALGLEEIKMSEKTLKERLSTDDTYLTVRVRESKVEDAIKEINKLGYAAKRLDLA